MFSARFYNYDPNLLFVQPPFWPNLGNAFTILTQRRISRSPLLKRTTRRGKDALPVYVW